MRVVSFFEWGRVLYYTGHRYLPCRYWWLWLDSWLKTGWVALHGQGFYGGHTHYKQYKHMLHSTRHIRGARAIFAMRPSYSSLAHYMASTTITIHGAPIKRGVVPSPSPSPSGLTVQPCIYVLDERAGLD